MDTSAAVEDRSSEDSERAYESAPNASVHRSSTNGEAPTQADEHQFQKAISAWRSNIALCLVL